MRAFERLGGVPARIRYDNLTSAVVRVMRGRGRQETERFIALRSHYDDDPAGSRRFDGLRSAWVYV